MKFYNNAFLFPVLLFSAALVLSSCELVTEDSPQPTLKPANHLVINEVFTLPPTHQRTFSWIEFYNPTKDTVNTKGWTFAFTTTGTIVKYAIDSLGRPIILSFRILRQGPGVYEVPMPEFKLQSGEFLTVTNNEERLLTYTDYGPGQGPKEAVGTQIRILTTTVTPDSSIPDTVLDFQAVFQLQTTDQLVIKDQNGSVVDVVRYGNYVYPGPDVDPYLGNRSTPLIPEYQSIARWNGAYFTGNSADDFYITGTQVPLTRPIPHWLSQAYHK